MSPIERRRRNGKSLLPGKYQERRLIKATQVGWENSRPGPPGIRPIKAPNHGFRPGIDRSKISPECVSPPRLPVRLPSPALPAQEQLKSSQNTTGLSQKRSRRLRNALTLIVSLRACKLTILQYEEKFQPFFLICGRAPKNPRFSPHQTHVQVR